MSTVEEDVAHVRAVTAALSGPQTVWVMKWQNKHGDGIDLFATERGARDHLLGILDDEWDTTFQLDDDKYAETRAKIDEGSLDNLNDSENDWYSIFGETVSP